MEFRFVFIWLHLRNSKPPAPQPSHTRARALNRRGVLHTRRLLVKWQASSGGKDQRDRNLDIENNRHTTLCALFPVPRYWPRKSPKTTPVCRFNVAVLQYSNASTDETRLACITDNMAASRRYSTTLVMLPRTLDKRVWMLKLNLQHSLRSPLPNPLT